MVFLQFVPFIVLLIAANLAVRASGWRVVTYVLLSLFNIALIFFGFIFLILPTLLAAQPTNPLNDMPFQPRWAELSLCCLLYTSDAADERSSVDLGGRRIIKKKKHTAHYEVHPTNTYSKNRHR